MKYLVNISFIKSDGIPTIILIFHTSFESDEVKLEEEKNT